MDVSRILVEDIVDVDDMMGQMMTEGEEQIWSSKEIESKKKKTKTNYYHEKLQLTSKKLLLYPIHMKR